MSNKWEDLKRELLRKNDYDTKRKVANKVKKELINKIDGVIIDSISVGYDNNKNVIILIDCHYQQALLIKGILIHNKILKVFNVKFNVNDSFPKANTIRPELMS